MIIGPIFTRELATSPRRGRHFAFRVVYTSTLMILMITSWLVLTGTQNVRTVGDMARFGASLFQVLAPLQLALVTFLSAIRAAGAVAQEKDRRTLILLMMTRLNNSELVLGKLMAGLLEVLAVLLAALPLFVGITLFGGVSMSQVVRAYGVTAATAFAAGSLGTMLAMWREKTFQTLAMTTLTIVTWIGAWEAVNAGLLGKQFLGLRCESLAAAFSPVRAILDSCRPEFQAAGEFSLGSFVPTFLVMAMSIAFVLCGWAMLRLRIWNPPREVRPGFEEDEGASIWGVEHDLQKANAEKSPGTDETARAGHVDSRLRSGGRAKSRQVWSNPVLWREICTWAYGRKVLIIKLGYLAFFAMAAWALHVAIISGATTQHTIVDVIPAGAKSLAPFCLVSLVIINALAVNSITNERDGNALDLLLVTDVTPNEFVFGKLGGVAWLCREMIVLPLLLCGYLFWTKGLTLENFAYTTGGLLIMDLFVAMLGLHCGMVYANSRTAIGVSLGVVFFLFLGVVTCLMMMISFSGSFQTQLGPFLLFIMGGAIGLFVALGARNPSMAIMSASVILPAATFFAIVSFILRNRELTVFLVSGAAYGFTTAAMLVPAISEFDFAMGRTKEMAEE